MRRERMNSQRQTTTIALLTTLLATLLASTALGATITGTIYDENLTVAANVLVQVNTQPAQRYFATNGHYSLTIPPGNYTITLTRIAENRTVTLHDELTVAGEGNYTYDLFLIPLPSAEEEELEEVLADLDEEPVQLPPASNEKLSAGLLAAITAIILTAIILITRHQRKKKNGREKITKGEERGEHSGVSAEASEILTLINDAGGRILQRELKRRIPASEAKISLLIAELEAKGKVEKIKRGRGNLLIKK